MGAEGLVFDSLRSSQELGVSVGRELAAQTAGAASIWQPQRSVSQLNQAGQTQAFLLPIVDTAVTPPTRDFNIPEPTTNAKSVLVIDVRSGRTLYARNPDQRLPIASITKLMTAVVILENLDLNQIYGVPIEDVNVDGLGADLYKDERLKGNDLFTIMLVKSSNDAAFALATAANKLGINLVAKMNVKARAIGMTSTHFADPAGLADKDSFSTASDLVKLIRYVDNYDKIWRVLRLRTADVASADGRIKHRLVNTDQLLGRIPDIIGGKTGYTDTALGTMVLYVKVGKADSIISVVLGSQDRFGDTKKLIDWVKKVYTW